jgi:hypothetical protein
MADMKEQQDRLIRLKRRRAFAWVACFALLFGMLAMPMTPTMPRTQGEQVVWGSFCTGNGTQLVATPLGLVGKVSQRAPDGGEHSSMQHCPCCSGSLSLVALPGGQTFGVFTIFEPVRFPSAILVFHAPPRQQWPSLNPRASPRV